MPIYRVRLNGEGIRVRFEGGDIPFGFYKNEIVWAKNSEQAIDRARAAVVTALHRDPAVNKTDLAVLSLQVDEIQSGMALKSLLERHGFAFYKLGAEKERKQ
jgi:hypothetical protein